MTNFKKIFPIFPISPIFSILLLTAIFLSLFRLPLDAAERILHMDVTADVAADAYVTVTERIELIAEGNRIKRGIVRVFPTDYEDARGRLYRTDFEFLTGSIDGRRAPVEVSIVGRNVEMQIGDVNRTLAPGRHVFEIRYRTRGWIAFRNDFDELFWNVTGNDWVFPIERATFRVNLPGGARIQDVAAFTGGSGAHGADYKIADDRSVATTRTLAPGEGLSVAYAWPKGFVTPPPPDALESVAHFVTTWRIPLAVVFVLAIFVYYFSAWYLIGRDPAQPTTIPLFHPPAGVEPGFAAYLRRMKFNRTCLTADIIHLAVKGYLYFEDDSDAQKTLRIMPTPRALGDEDKEKKFADLSEPMRNLLNGLFLGAGRGGVAVADVNGDVFQRVGRRLEFDYKNRAKRYFMHNRLYSIFGLLLFVPMIAAVVLMNGPWLDLGAMVGPSVFAVVLLLRFLNRPLLALFAGGAIFASIGILSSFDAVLFGALVAGFAIALFFSRIMPVRTAEGARVMAEIDGLAMYMGTAERHRLAMLNPPDETPQLFESLLPYAYALDCAETWVNSFEGILKKAAYKPNWDHGPNAGTFNWMLFSNRMNSGLYRGIDRSVASFDAAQRAKAAKSSSYRGGSGFGGGGGGAGRGGGGGGGRGF